MVVLVLVLLGYTQYYRIIVKIRSISFQLDRFTIWGIIRSITDREIEIDREIVR